MHSESILPGEGISFKIVTPGRGDFFKIVAPGTRGEIYLAIHFLLSLSIVCLSGSATVPMM